MIRSSSVAVLTITVCLLLAGPPARGQAGMSAFTYQGHLVDAGGPVTGTCDFDFSLWDAQTGGSQIGATVSQSLAVSGGLFSTVLDFGTTAFPGDGAPRFLQADVDCGSGPATLPRQQLTSSPYAITSFSTNALQGGPVSGAAPGANEVLMWDGAQWAPSVEIGDISGVTAGAGLTGGGSSGDATLAVDTSAIQARVTGTCPAGSSIRAVALDGTVTCEADTDTDTHITGHQIATATCQLVDTVGDACITTAACPGAQQILGGGTVGRSDSIGSVCAGMRILANGPSSGSTWVGAVRMEGICGEGPYTVTVSAICADLPAGNAPQPGVPVPEVELDAVVPGSR